MSGYSPLPFAAMTPPSDWPPHDPPLPLLTASTRFRNLPRPLILRRSVLLRVQSQSRTPCQRTRKPMRLRNAPLPVAVPPLIQSTGVATTPAHTVHPPPGLDTIQFVQTTNSETTHLRCSSELRLQVWRLNSPSSLRRVRSRLNGSCLYPSQTPLDPEWGGGHAN